MYVELSQEQWHLIARAAMQEQYANPADWVRDLALGHAALLTGDRSHLLPPPVTEEEDHALS